MILIDCQPCGHRHLVSNGRVRGLHTTDEGLFGYVECPESGATLIQNFTTNTTVGELKDATINEAIPTPA